MRAPLSRILIIHGEGDRRGGFDVEYNDKGNTIADSAPINILLILPLCCSPRSSLQQCPHANNNNKVRQQETNVNAKGVTSAPAMDAALAALRKAESTIKAQKTKKLVKQTQGAQVHCRCNCKADWTAGSRVIQRHGRNNQHDVDAPDEAH